MSRVSVKIRSEASRACGCLDKSPSTLYLAGLLASVLCPSAVGSWT